MRTAIICRVTDKLIVRSMIVACPDGGLAGRQH
jgi:hypothetical protein